MFKFLVIICLLKYINLQDLTFNSYNLKEVCFCDEYSFVIDLKNVNISTIHVGTFNGLTSLRSLKLSNNKLTSIDANTFNGLTSLVSQSVRLSVSGNSRFIMRHRVSSF